MLQVLRATARRRWFSESVRHPLLYPKSLISRRIAHVRIVEDVITEKVIKDMV
jgi:hypothetical protein